MSTDRDTTRIVRSWLRTDDHESADRVLDAVLSVLDTTPQRRPGWPVRRVTELNNVAKALIAAAAVVALGVVGLNLVPRSGNVGPPSSTASASPSSTPSASTYVWPTSLAPGTYATDFAFALPVAVRFTVPDGWESRDINVRKDDRIAMMVLVVEDLFADACGRRRATAVDPTVEGLANALADLPGLTAETPRPSALGGLQGTYLEWALRSDAGCEPLAARIFHLAPLVCDADCRATGARDIGVEFDREGVLNRTWILDAGGRLRLVIQGVSTPDASAAELAELQAVLDSVSVERTAAPTAPPQPSGS